MRTVTIQTAILAAALICNDIPHFEFFEVKEFVGDHALTVALVALDVLGLCLASVRVHHSEL